MYISICIDALFSGETPDSVMKTLSSLGCSYYEFWGWTAKDIPSLKAAQEAYCLNLSAFCTKSHSLTDKSRHDKYLTGLKESIAVAKTLGCRTLISQVGNDIPTLSREAQRCNIIEGLRACIPLLETEGITLVFEPLNQTNHKGTFLSLSSEAFAIAAELSHPSIRVLYDIYHQQITEGNILATLRQNISLIGHIHAAGVPERGELSKGELNYPKIFCGLADMGYQGAVGLEYFPIENAEDGLKEALLWAKRL